MERKSEEFCRSSLCQPIGLLHSCYNNILPHVLWNRRIPSRKYMYPIYCCAEPLKLFTNTCKILPFFAHWNKPSFLLWYVLPPMWRQSQDIAHLFHWFALISKMDFLKKFWGRRGQRTIEVHSLLYPKTKGSWYIKIIV